MALVEMKKLTLVAMSYDRDAVLNALQKTGAAEIKEAGEREDTFPLGGDGAQLKEYLATREAALETLINAVSNFEKDNKIKSGKAEEQEITCSQFLAADSLKHKADSLVEKVNALTDEKQALESELVKVRRNIASAEAYSTLEEPFSSFASTRRVRVRLGTVPANVADGLIKALNETELCGVEELARTQDCALLLVAVHKSAAADAEGALQSAGFTVCPYTEGTGAQLYADLIERERRIREQLDALSVQTYALKEGIGELKIYCDRVAFELEKAELSSKMRGTERTFIMEAYVPAGAEEAVRSAISSVTGAAYCNFTVPDEDEIPPTLYKNNAVVKNFETVTNMYSVPSSREFDPSTVMGIFYSIFLGFIMADVGYGLLMFAVGLFINLKQKRDTGLKRIAGIFAAGGIFAAIWGVLFNSFFGIELKFMPTVMPNPQSAMWSLAGISVPSVLIISMLIGVVQLCVGYICRAVQCWRRGQIFDGICDGVFWALFSVGVELAIVGFVDEFNVPVLVTVGGITAGVSLLAAMLTAGRHEKLLGKFTKGFGAAYGVINYASDVLSYARLYGLMLSGVVIAQIISGYAVTGMNGGVGFIFSGNVALVILGVILMVVGHVFNIAIGLLGAYIHDARLQYVEFYGRFFEGEGTLFSPVGSNHKYIYVKPDPQAAEAQSVAAEAVKA